MLDDVLLAAFAVSCVFAGAVVVWSRRRWYAVRSLSDALSIICSWSLVDRRHSADRCAMLRPHSHTATPPLIAAEQDDKLNRQGSKLRGSRVGTPKNTECLSTKRRCRKWKRSVQAATFIRELLTCR